MALAACNSAPSPTPAGSAASSAPYGSSSAASAAPRATAVAFIEDDLPRGLAEAAAAHKRVLVDVWAPWCDACLSLRAEVLSRPELARYADRFVFVSLDTDRPGTEPFLAKHGARTLPTLAVLDAPNGELVALRGGAVSFDALAAMLDDAAGSSAHAGPRDVLTRGHAAYAKGDRREAAALFESAAASGAGEVEIEATLAALDAWASVGEPARCARLAEAHVGAVHEGAGRSMLLGYWVRCALQLPAGVEKAKALAAVERAVHAAIDAPATGASALENADALALAAELRSAAGDENGARALGLRRIAELEEGERSANTPAHQESFDHALSGAYVAMKRGDEAVRLLEKRTRERPDGYETHGRLGTVLLSLGRASEAIGPLERAVELGYGPPKLVYLGRLAAAYDAVGRKDDARRATETEVAGWAALPAAQRDGAREAEANARLGGRSGGR